MLLELVLNCFDAAALLAEQKLLLIVSIKFNGECVIVEISQIEASRGRLFDRMLVEFGHFFSFVVAGTRLIALTSLAMADLLVNIQIIKKIVTVVLIIIQSGMVV